MDVVPMIPETKDCKILKAPSWLIDACHYLQIHEGNDQGFADHWFFADEEPVNVGAEDGEGEILIQ